MPANFVVPDGYQTLGAGKALAVLDVPGWADVKGEVSTVFLSRSPKSLQVVDGDQMSGLQGETDYFRKCG